MKSFINKIIISIILFLVQTISSGQEIRSKIEAELSTEYGPIFKANALVYVPGRVGTYNSSSLEFTDPYGTLTDCFIFAATSNKNSIDPKGIVGIYKNNEIVWHSGPVITTDAIYNQVISGTVDLNNNGNVEIITAWYEGMDGYRKQIWVFSWNGLNGTLLNDTTKIGETTESDIFAIYSVPEVIDIEADGIIELIGIDEKTYSAKIYSWNGINYGDYGVHLPNFVPMNLLSAKVTCDVNRSRHGFLYSYTLSNDATSDQPIWRFAVEKPYEFVKAGSDDPNIKWAHRYSKNWDILIWNISNDEKYYPFDYIYPGDVRNDFNLETEAPLIYIGNYYVQGKNGKKIYTDQYIKENSFDGKTICGKYPSEPFVPQEFLDTLKSYNNQSFNLGWIQTQENRDKYNNYFNNAKNYLEQNNNNAAKSELQLVLNQCNADSSTVLTSEAYALLYFNTEYLIEQIPDSQPGLPVKLQDSQGNLLQGGSLQYYDGSWMDAINNGNGTFNVITERTTVSIRMTYEGGNQQFNNVVVGPDTVAFQTVNSTVQLLDSQGNLIQDEGIVQYYAGSWREFGTTSNGTVSKELLPKNYSFRMTHEGVSNDKAQDIGVEDTVSFSTVFCVVQVKDAQDQPVNGAEVKYYSGSWWDIGVTENGELSKELLPKNLSFRVIYNGVVQNKQQDIGSNRIVEFVVE